MVYVPLLNGMDCAVTSVLSRVMSEVTVAGPGAARLTGDAIVLFAAAGDGETTVGCEWNVGIGRRNPKSCAGENFNGDGSGAGAVRRCETPAAVTGRCGAAEVAGCALRPPDAPDAVVCSAAERTANAGSAHHAAARTVELRSKHDFMANPLVMRPIVRSETQTRSSYGNRWHKEQSNECVISSVAGAAQAA